VTGWREVEPVTPWELEQQQPVQTLLVVPTVGDQARLEGVIHSQGWERPTVRVVCNPNAGIEPGMALVCRGWDLW
jgi:hypothetical protein